MLVLSQTKNTALQNIATCYLTYLKHIFKSLEIKLYLVHLLFRHCSHGLTDPGLYESYRLLSQSGGTRLSSYIFPFRLVYNKIVLPAD